MEKFEKIKIIVCPKCESANVKQISNTERRITFECLDCKTIWSQPNEI
jgi:hypothetical protein